MEQEISKKTQNNWLSIIPWFLTVSSTGVLIILGYFLYENLIWLRTHAFLDYDQNKLVYRSHSYVLYISVVKKSIGMFTGIALMFLGIAVALYHVKNQTTMNVSSQNFTISLITASPGIIAIIIGAFLVAHNTSSKDTIPIYDGRESYLKPDLDITDQNKTQLSYKQGDKPPLAIVR